MTESDLENAEVDLRSENMRDVLEALTCKRNIVFVKELRPTHVPRINHTCNGLLLPGWFVEENMESLCKSVVLVTNKAWNLRFSVTRSRRVIPQVVFSGGWEAFAVSNNLAQGDQLIFKYSGVSHFDVYIFNADGSPKDLPPTDKAQMKWSDVSELPKVKKIQSSQFKHDSLDVEDSEVSANGLYGLFAKEEIQELPGEQEKDADECKDHSLREEQKLHPSFFKRLKLNNFRRSHGVPCLEIPIRFARLHSSQLQTPVMLQGIYEESPVCTVTCDWERTSLGTRSRRLFLRSGWKEFGDANNLELGQELEFTLMLNSFFVVRDRPPMNCSDLSELPKEKKFKSSKFRHDSLVVEDSEASTNRLCGSFVKEEIQELPDEQEKDADECKNYSPKVSRKLHPSFFRRLTPNNFWRNNGVPCQLEVPAKFAWKYGNRLLPPVLLQGIYEESLVCTVACRWERSSTEIRSPRLFLRAGWKEFGDANRLEEGQQLEFTLISESFFVVREKAS